MKRAIVLLAVALVLVAGVGEAGHAGRPSTREVDAMGKVRSKGDKADKARKLGTDERPEWLSAVAHAVECMRGPHCHAPGLGYMLEQFTREPEPVRLETGGELLAWLRLAASREADDARSLVVAELLASARRLLDRAVDIGNGGPLPSAGERRALRVAGPLGWTDEVKIERGMFLLFAERSALLVRRDAAHPGEQDIEAGADGAAALLPARLRGGVTPELVRETGDAWSRRGSSSRGKPMKWAQLARIARRLGYPAASAATYETAWREIHAARERQRRRR